MRVIMILRGIPGCGKSTFIRNENLEDFTIESDKVREMYNGYRIDREGKMGIPQDHNKEIWETIHQIIELRMQKGEFIVVDATTSKDSELTKYKKLAREYKYRLHILDFTPIAKTEEEQEEYIQQCIKQNKKRPQYKQVPEEVIRRMYNNIKELQNGNYKPLTLETWKERVYYRKQNLNNYKKVNLIADIHGGYDELKYLIPEIKEDEMYIFLGDYVDRGVQNKEVIEWVYENIEKENVIFLEGNHEGWLRYHTNNEIDKIRSSVYKYKTLPQIEQIEDWKRKTRRITERLQQVYYFEYKGVDYLCSHAGVPYWDERIVTYPTEMLFNTRMDRDLLSELYHKHLEYSENPTKVPRQVIGHIGFKDGENVKGLIYNITSTSEFGGTMNLMTLKENGEVEIIKVDEQTILQGKTTEEKEKRLVDKMLTHEYIKQGENINNIISINFTKSAFYKKVWDKVTTKARGLFYDTENHKIVARGYDKFFNYGEFGEEATENIKTEKGINLTKEEYFEKQEIEWEEYWKDNIHYPVVGYNKENGFLGMITYYNGEVYYATKSVTRTLQTPQATEECEIDRERYVTIFREQIKRKFKDIENFEEKIKKYEGYTFLFEVVNPKEDPHVIEYTEEEMILLDLVKNTILETEYLGYEELKEVAKEIRVKVKEEVKVINNWEDLRAYVKEVRENCKTEGVVLKDNNNNYFKVKTKYYNNWKELRDVLKLYRKEKDIKFPTENTEAREFMKFLNANKVDPNKTMWEIKREYENRG